MVNKVRKMRRYRREERMKEEKGGRRRKRRRSKHFCDYTREVVMLIAVANYNAIHVTFRVLSSQQSSDPIHTAVYLLTTVYTVANKM